MVNFYLHDLSSDNFEILVCDICRNILGMGSLKFSAGKDGGRDGFYHGKSNKFNNLEGNFIIQAKWTSALEASCTDKKFHDIVDEEIPKVNSLVNKNEVDYYIIFTNRKLSAETNSIISKKIIDETGVKHAYLVGVEQLGEYIVSDEDIINKHNLRPQREPLRINPEDLKTIILEFDKNKEEINREVIKRKAIAFDIEKKNKTNNLSDDYYKGSILKHSNIRFTEIDSFLEDPVNDEYNDLYQEIISEFQSKVIIRLKDVKYFEDIFDLMYDEILKKIPDLKDKKRLINIFLHYMYINCDIGKEPEE